MRELKSLEIVALWILCAGFASSQLFSNSSISRSSSVAFPAIEDPISRTTSTSTSTISSAADSSSISTSLSFAAGSSSSLSFKSITSITSTSSAFNSSATSSSTTNSTDLNSDGTSPDQCNYCLVYAQRFYLSYTLRVREEVQTQVATLVPYVVVYGDNQTVTSTSTYVDYTANATSFSDFQPPTDTPITWVTFGSTLTYPTTYGAYIDVSVKVAQQATSTSSCTTASIQVLLPDSQITLFPSQDDTADTSASQAAETNAFAETDVISVVGTRKPTDCSPPNFQGGSRTPAVGFASATVIHTSVKVLTSVADPVTVSSRGPVVQGQTTTSPDTGPNTETAPASIPAGIVVPNTQAQIIQTVVTPGGGVNPETVVNGATLTAIIGGGVAVGGQTVNPGGVATLSDGTPVSVPSAGGSVVVGGESAPLPTPAPAVIGNPGSPTVVNGATITPIVGGGVVVGGQTIAPGSAVTLGDGTPVSVAVGGNSIVVGGQSASLPSFPGSPATVNGATITPLAGGGAVIGGQTVTPGQVVTLSDGSTVSLASTGSVVVVNGQTATLAGFPVVASIAAGTPTVINGETITPIAGGGAIANGQTVFPGGLITLSDGQTLSLASSGSVIVVGGQTATLPAITGGTPVTLDGETITPAPTGGAVTVDGLILSPGNVMTLSDGKVLFVGTSGTVVIDGTSYILPQTTSASNTTSSSSSSSSTRSNSSIGAAIASGLNPKPKKGESPTLGYDHLLLTAWIGAVSGLIGVLGLI